MLNHRFWSKVNKSAPNGCWEWKGARNNKGYCTVSVRYLGFREKQLVHRMSFLERNGTLTDGLFVLHKCDNPICVNPDHLWEGTQLDNVKDMWTKGRASHPPRNDGDKRKGAKINYVVAKQIKAMTASGLKQKDIARYFGISRYIVRHVQTGAAWKDT